MGSKRNKTESQPPPVDCAASEPEPEPVVEPEPELVAVPVPPKARPSLRPMFAAYEQRDKELTQAEHDFEMAGVRRSEAVKAIMEAAGHKGPFRYDGNVVTIVGRTTKDTSGAEPVEKVVYFFKGQRQGVVDVD